ncbi:hypothetical protein diail_5814 [Diaporthe ilicicola]|nr:hypothetical protein diail_5814 [Diaporthe ilicicola]
MAIFTALIIFSIFLLQAAGQAFPTIILQKHDGVFPNVTNTNITNTTSAVLPLGTSVVPVYSLREVDQMVAEQVKRYKDSAMPVNNDEILPGYGKTNMKRHHHCELTCSPSYMVDLCKDYPVLASCSNNCTFKTKGPFPLSGGHGQGSAPLSGNNSVPNANVTADQEHIACETSGLSKGSVDQDDLDNLPAIRTTDYENGDATPDTVIRAGTEIHKPLLEASTGSTMIPVSEEQVRDGQLYKKATFLHQSPAPPNPNPDLTRSAALGELFKSGVKLLLPDQVPTGEADPQPEEKAQPHLNSRLFARNRPLAIDGVLMENVLVTDPPSADPTSVDDDKGADIEYDGEEAEGLEADTEDED